MFRGGLTSEALETLLEGEDRATVDDTTEYDHNQDTSSLEDTILIDSSTAQYTRGSPSCDGITRQTLHPSTQSRPYAKQPVSYYMTESLDSHREGDDHDEEPAQRVPLHDQRTLLITGLSDRITHKDLAGVIRGGRLLDIFLRNDRSASISFVEGAAEFLSYAKRTDIYVHMKRVSGK